MAKSFHRVMRVFHEGIVLRRNSTGERFKGVRRTIWNHLTHTYTLARWDGEQIHLKEEDLHSQYMEVVG